MHSTAAHDLANAIKANSERRSLSELAAEGKRHVRVVSGQRVMQIIEALVDDAIRNEASEIARKDRDRIVDETRSQFDRVMKITAEQDAQVRQWREEAERQERRAAAAIRKADELAVRLEQERADQANRESRYLSERQAHAGETDVALRRAIAERDAAKEAASEASAKATVAQERLAKAEAEAEELFSDLREALAKTTDALEEKDRQNESLREAIDAGRSALEAQRESGRKSETEIRAEYEARLSRLSEEHSKLVARFEGERGELAGRQEAALEAAHERVAGLEEEVREAHRDAAAANKRAERLEEELRRLTGEEAAMRATVNRQEAEITRLSAGIKEKDQELAARLAESGNETIARLEGELAELKGLVRGAVDRPADSNEEAMESLLSRLAEREDKLEGRFNVQMDRTLEEINRALRVATMKPIDVDVEATDVLVDRIFDHESEMKTNLGNLAVEEKTSGNGIGDHLARLREARKKAASAGNQVPA